MSKMPKSYPGGEPISWKEDQDLPEAMIAFMDVTIYPERSYDVARFTKQFASIVEYCTYFINAPCWQEQTQHDASRSAQLTSLRERIASIKDAQVLDQWIEDCFKIGVDLL